MILASVLPHVVIGTVVVPFLGAGLCVLCGRRGGAVIGLGVAVVLLFLSGMVGVQLARTGVSSYAIGGWGYPLGIDIRVDGLSFLMIMTTSFVGTAISFYATGYFGKSSDGDDHQGDGRARDFFWSLWLFAWGGLNVLFVSGDIFNLYVALEIVSFSAVALVALGGSVAAAVAATRYLFLTVVASAVYLLGVGLVYSARGTLDLAALGLVSHPGGIFAVAVALITVGLMIKSALFPVHFWLPPAHANAPVPVSAILSGLVVMGAFYVLVRLWFGVFAVALVPAAGHILGVCGSVAILWGSWQAFRQSRLKMMVAYSTVAQIGYMFLIFPLVASGSVGGVFAWSGALYLAASHACAKAAAFMVAGSIIRVLGHDRVDDFHGLVARYPLGMFTFALAGVSLIGLPPSGGFVGKWLLLKGAMLSGQWGYALVMMVGGLLAAAYIFRVLENGFHAVEQPVKSTVRVPWSMQVAALILALTAVGLGIVAFEPLALMNIDAPFVGGLVEGNPS